MKLFISIYILFVCRLLCCSQTLTLEYAKSEQITNMLTNDKITRNVYHLYANIFATNTPAVYVIETSTDFNKWNSYYTFSYGPNFPFEISPFINNVTNKTNRVFISQIKSGILSESWIDGNKKIQLIIRTNQYFRLVNLYGNDH